MIMSADELKIVLEKHQKWLNNESGGKRANLCWANLREANLSGADLSEAILCGADLSEADLCGADLSEAILCEADLRGAILCGASLCEADLCGASLHRANLYGADLSGADLYDAKLWGAHLHRAENVPYLPQTIIHPTEGAFIGWKKVDDYIIKLQICEDAKRSCATGRKCRCDKALVLAIENKDGTSAGIKEITNKNYAPNVVYKVGEIVTPDSFDEDRWNECSHGIHFFMMRQEAVDY